MKASTTKGERAKTRILRTDYLARVEGEGALRLRVKGDRVEDAKLEIFEPPRFFEGFLVGRDHLEVPDLTARICGICPIAYQTSSVRAIERILGIEVSPEIDALRRLIYCGEWIESHALHVFMLHLPDFMGYDGAIEMAADHRDLVRAALDVKKAGNALVALAGGREIHPINLRVGGFYRAPDRSAFDDVRAALEKARSIVLESSSVLADLDYPDFERDYTFLALREPDHYPVMGDRLVSNRGLDVDVEAFDLHFEERHERHSTALHGRTVDGEPYFVGPLARYALNHDRLDAESRDLADAVGLEAICRNPFRSILVRTVELHAAIVDAIGALERYVPPDPPYVEASPRAGAAAGCSEAPRGICWHRYALDDAGRVVEARIVPPTAQNQPSIEADLAAFAQDRLELDDERLRWSCEQAIRNYDPCISCSTHALRLVREDV